MGNKIQVVQGVNDPIDVQLLLVPGQLFGQSPQNVVPVQWDATYNTVTIQLTTADGTPPPSVTGKVSWRDITKAIVRYQPGPNDLRFSQSPYRVRWIVTDGAGNQAAWPRFTAPDIIEVGN